MTRSQNPRVKPEGRPGTLVLLEPKAENLLGAVGSDAERNVDRLVADKTLIADFDPQRIEEDQGIDRLKRPRLPGRDLVQNRVGHRADQIRRNVDAVDLAAMPGDLAGAHASGIHRDDLLVEPGKPPLIFRDQLRVEARLAIPRHVQIELARIRRHRLATIAVAAIAGAGFTAKMVIHLGVQRPLRQRLLQFVDQTARLKSRLRIGAGQKLVKQRVGNLRFLASGHEKSPSFSYCPPNTEFLTLPRPPRPALLLAALQP